jgi:hypothetical protein
MGDIVKASGMGHREKAALLAHWKRNARGYFGDYLSASRYDTSRDELILPDGARLAVASVEVAPRTPQRHTRRGSPPRSRR